MYSLIFRYHIIEVYALFKIRNESNLVLNIPLRQSEVEERVGRQCI